MSKWTRACGGLLLPQPMLIGGGAAKPMILALFGLLSASIPDNCDEIRQTRRQVALAA